MGVNLTDNQVRRLAVISRDKRLVGIVALADLATKGEEAAAEDALEGVSRPTQEPG